MMFSATFPKTARAMAREYMAEDYVRIRVGRAGQSHKNIRQSVIEVEHDQKRRVNLEVGTKSIPMESVLTSAQRRRHLKSGINEILAVQSREDVNIFTLQQYIVTCLIVY